ncbi:hypothetical protein DC083_02345 [Ignatzschineria ureiclastica]|uniref:Glycosyltransferase 2-like domain-containing protein n=1 Tax=Ignatzschineria ureiclastica TaxID=472582 RepID=A0A2U2AHA9_9GAMM|nr:glycosyltransferase family 2 protein [Ignatzschineria ureiclastica]PWD82044.1 hypothetical protein DC083_02345 [Ignatzschineria ureiclastica]GGZ92259.1 hypothetical protein GCM10007162_04550 [Ignatzschineria ureiclastica]
MNKYSIIIPAYNIEKYTTKILDYISAILKKRRDVEFIIVDDGSTDKTYALLKHSKDIVLYRQNNKGVSVARNKGIDLATGTYILFLDADDSFSEKIFEILDSYIKKNNHELIAYNYTLSNNQALNAYPMTEYKPQNLSVSFLKKNINIHICSVCFNRDFIVKNELRFPTGYPFGEDVYFILQSILTTRKNILYIPDILFRYNFDASQTVASAMTQGKIKVLSLYQLIKTDNVEIEYALEYFIQRTYLYLVKIALKYGVDSKKTIDYLKESVSVLNNSIKIQPQPFDFKVAKFFIKHFQKLFFSFIKVR